MFEGDKRCYVLIERQVIKCVLGHSMCKSQTKWHDLFGIFVKMVLNFRGDLEISKPMETIIPRIRSAMHGCELNYLFLIEFKYIKNLF